MAEPTDPGAQAENNAAFLLTQLGTHAANQFAERVGELGLTPPQVGILAMIDSRPGLSQQALAGELGLLPSKVVSFIDQFESRGLVTRTRGTMDRRVYELRLTEDGAALLRRARAVADAHEAAFFATLDPEEHDTLRALLRRLSSEHGLAAGIHPGYRNLS